MSKRLKELKLLPRKKLKGKGKGKPAIKTENNVKESKEKEKMDHQDNQFLGDKGNASKVMRRMSDRTMAPTTEKVKAFRRKQLLKNATGTILLNEIKEEPNDSKKANRSRRKMCASTAPRPHIQDPAQMLYSAIRRIQVNDVFWSRLHTFYRLKLYCPHIQVSN